MDDEKYEEIINRLERIEEYLRPLAQDTSYGKKILSNIIGNMVWEWLYYGTSGIPIHPPKN